MGDSLDDITAQLCEDLPGTDAFEAINYIASRYIHIKDDEGKIVKTYALEPRIVSANGKGFMVLDNLSSSRINLTIRNNVVVKAEVY